MRRQTALDILLLGGVLTLLSFSQLPRLVHETVGILMLFAILTHLGYARGWLRSLMRGRWDVRRVLSTAVNSLLAMDIMTIFVTGVIASNYIFTDFVPLALHRNTLLRQLHTALGWSVPILVGLHIGLHGTMLWKKFTHHCGIRQEAKATGLIGGGLAAAIIALGIYGSILNRMGDRLCMEHIFATETVTLPGIIFALLILMIIGMYTILAAGLVILIQRK